MPQVVCAQVGLAPQMANLLALDQASITTGYAIFKDGKYSSHGKFSFDDHDIGIRLMKIRNNVLALIEENEITITSNNPEIGNATETVSCITEGNGLEIAFNAKYISEMLKTIEEEYMTFQCNTPVSPACLKPASDDHYLYVVTPVRVAY